MSTVRDLIGGSLRLLGAKSSGENIPATEAADALSALNQMLDSWSLEKLTLYARTTEVFTLTVGQQSRTIGPLTGNFVTGRPISIERAEIRSLDASPVDSPLEIIGLDQWTQISSKQTQASTPQKLFYEATNPLGTLYFWPVPSVANQVVLYSWKVLTQFASVNDTVAFPPGYERALKFNLAVEMAPEYGKSASVEIVQGAIESKENIKRINLKTPVLFCDSGLLGRGKTFNILTGE